MEVGVFGQVYPRQTESFLESDVVASCVGKSDQSGSRDHNVVSSITGLPDPDPQTSHTQSVDEAERNGEVEAILEARVLRQHSDLREQGR